MSLSVDVSEEMHIAARAAMTHNDSFDSTASTVSPGRTSPGLRSLNVINKRRTPTQLFNNGEIRIMKRSISNDAAQTPRKPDLLSSILNSMSKFEQSVGFDLRTAQILHSERRERDARLQAEKVANISCIHELTNRCKNCGEDKFEENDERYMVCIECGAVNGSRQDNASLGFESVARGEVHSADSDKALVSTLVNSKQLNSIQRSINNQASREQQTSKFGCPSTFQTMALP